MLPYDPKSPHDLDPKPGTILWPLIALTVFLCIVAWAVLR